MSGETPTAAKGLQVKGWKELLEKTVARSAKDK